MTRTATSSSSPSPCSDAWNACAVPWNVVLTVGGDPQLALDGLDLRPPLRSSETPGLVSNEIVTAGSWPRWSTVSGPSRGVSVATASSGTSLPSLERT